MGSGRSFEYPLTWEKEMLPEWILKRQEIEKSKSELRGADLCDAKLMKAQLEHADLSKADLTSAYLIKANLKGANLSDTNLSKAILSEANLQGADLADAELSETYLCGANLSEVVNLTCDQLELAILDKETLLPDYIKITWINEDLFDCKECSG